MSDTEKVQVLIRLCREFSQINTKKSISYGSQALKLSRDLHYTTGISSSLLYLAHSYLIVNNKRNALNLQLQLLEVCKNNNDQEGQAQALQLIGNTYVFLGGYPEALHYLFKALTMYEHMKNPQKSSILLENIGITYQKQGNDSTALKYFLQSMRLLEQQNEKDYSDLTMTANDIAYVYKETNELNKSLQYFQKALMYAKKISGAYNAHVVSMILTNIGTLYANKKNYKQAFAYNQKTLDLAQQKNNLILKGLGFENRARIYKSMTAFDRSTHYYLKADSIFQQLNMEGRIATVLNAVAENYLSMKELNQAESYALQALKIARRGNIPEESEKALKHLIIIDKQTGNYKKALAFQEQYHSIRDTLLNKEKADQIIKLQILYETGKKQEQIEMLRIQESREEILRYVLLGCIAFLMIIGVLLYRQQQMKNRKDKMLSVSQQALIQEQLKNTRLHEQQLQHDIQSKNKELTTYALNFIQKNQLLEELKDRLADIRKNTDGALSGKLGGLQHIIRHSFNLDKDWDEFRLYFEQVHDRFFKVLNSRYPGLSNKELRLCALLKINLSTKEMASLLGISAASVKMARYRLRKKLRLDSENDLTCFMINLEKEVSEKAGEGL
ncbi:MAG TPA: tetratricopeptide repeat protein [Chitinophagaceae bacterium]|nr:tetratricopeptide repeat protein [Chitinophagaceae bacterium]